MPVLCENCGGRFDRPGLMGCRVRRHPKPDVAQRIVAIIEFDLSDRRGLGQQWDQIDDECKVAIRDEWAKIIRKQLRRRL